MKKVKRIRTADCVVGGFPVSDQGRPSGITALGPLRPSGLVKSRGLYIFDLHAERAKLTRRLEKIKGPPGFTGISPAGPSRWSTRTQR